MPFQTLSKELQEVVSERFDKPTVSQEAGIPPILKGENVLLMAPTGTGKTESVLIPIFDMWAATKPKPVSILYVTPLKALNRDLHERILWWANKLDFGVSVRHGDTTQRERRQQVENPDDMLVVTCEQIQAMLTGERMRNLLKNVKWVVIDEVHELVDSKRGVQLAVALERLHEVAGEFQTIALSATVGAPEAVADFIFGGRKHKIVSALAEKKLDVKVECPFPKAEDKLLAEKLFIGDTVAARLHMIYDLMKSHNAVLAFTNTREAAEVLSSRLRTLDKAFEHDVHHSSLSKENRLKTEREFKEQKLKAIIATSSLQLGIDIGAIDLVVQYMSPREVTQFVQRLGRAGHRIDKTSKGVIIAGDGDDIFESAVIARKTIANELEKPRLHVKSMDVLAHQILGLAMSNYQIPQKQVYDVVRRATPYKDLTREEFDNLLKFLESIHLLWSDQGLKRKRRGLEYYFNSMSMIPDKKTYRIIDITSNTPVATLDEAFVSEHSETGASFIVKGRPWRVVQVEKDKLYVEPMIGLESAVPAWQGELIPVPFSVSQEVGRIRRNLADMMDDGQSQTDILHYLKTNYPLSSQAAKHMLSLMKKQKDFSVPDDKQVVFENVGEFTVMHACFGSLVNETLARFISAILSAEQGRTIASKSDPYRIIFGSTLSKDIMEVFEKYKPEDIKAVLELALPNSSLFKHRFINIAKKIGAIRRDARFERVGVDRIIKVYQNTPLFDEVLNEIFTEKLDTEKASEVFAKIKSGKVKFVDGKGLSPLGELGLKYELHDVAKPDRPEAEILKVFKQRLLNTKIRLVCVSCGKYDIAQQVKDVAKEPRCPKCTSKLLACVSPYMTESKNIIQKRLKGKELSNEELKKLERIKHSADIIIVYGKKGATALAGRGIGPQTAARVLARMHRSGDEFYKDILRAEREFVRTKKFWSD